MRKTLRELREEYEKLCDNAKDLSVEERINRAYLVELCKKVEKYEQWN